MEKYELSVFDRACIDRYLPGTGTRGKQKGTFYLFGFWDLPRGQREAFRPSFLAVDACYLVLPLGVPRARLCRKRTETEFDAIRLAAQRGSPF